MMQDAGCSSEGEEVGTLKYNVTYAVSKVRMDGCKIDTCGKDTMGQVRWMGMGNGESTSYWTVMDWSGL